MNKWGRRLVWVLGGIVLLVVVLVLCINLTYRRDFSATPLPAIKASNDPAVIAQGAYLVHAVGHCSACHGPADRVAERTLSPNKGDLRGGYAMKAGPFGTFYPSNLTADPDTGLGKRSDAEIARVIRHGVAPDGRFDPIMAFAVGPMADEDLVSIVSYLRTVSPVKNAVPPDEWGFIAKALAFKFDPRSGEAPKYVPPGEVNVARGGYLANGPAVCAGCHSVIDPTKGFDPIGPKFIGEGEPDPDVTDRAYEIIAPNLTPDPETGALAAYSEDGFVNRVRAGTKYRGSKMPWDNFAQMTDADLKSIFRYLQTLPPVRRSVGETRRPRRTPLPK